MLDPEVDKNRGAARKTKVSDLYTIREGSFDTDRDDILRLWRLLPADDPPQGEKLDWFYRGNPEAGSVVYFLDYLPERRPVGIVCVCKRLFRIGDRTVEGGVFGDFAIEQGHRSLGPALMFQREFLKSAYEAFDVVYGFPNDVSGSVRTFGGYKLDGRLDMWVLPLDPKPYLARRMPRTLAGVLGTVLGPVWKLRLNLKTKRSRERFTPASASNAFQDALWTRCDDGALAAGIRDAGFVDWRLGRSPYKDFEFVGVNDTDGKPAGYAGWQVRPDGTVQVEDFLVVDDEALTALVGSLAASPRVRESRAIAIGVTRQATSVASRLKSLGFSRRKDIQFFVGISDRLRDTVAAENLTFTFADNDV